MLPSAWSSYAFKLCFRGRTLKVRVDQEATTVTRLQEALTVCVNEEFKRSERIESVGPCAVVASR